MKRSLHNLGSSEGDLFFKPNTSLDNLFSGYELDLKNTNVLRHLQDCYSQIDHPFANNIANLLALIIDFRSKTNLDFAEVRDQNISDQEFILTFNSLAQALIQARDKLNTQTEEFKPSDYKTLADAIEYCIGSLVERLNSLQLQNDRVYDVFTGSDNGLKDLIRQEQLTAPRNSL